VKLSKNKSRCVHAWNSHLLECCRYSFQRCLGQLKNGASEPWLWTPSLLSRASWYLGLSRAYGSRKHHCFLVSVFFLMSSLSLYTCFLPCEQCMNSNAMKHSGGYTERRNGWIKGSCSGSNLLLICLWTVASYRDTTERDCQSSWVPMWHFGLISLFSLLCEKILEKK